MADTGAKFGWKVFGGVAGLAGAMAARQAVRATWKATTGKEPPGTPESPMTSWSEAIGWAFFSGTVVALARLAATRSAAKTWTRAAGSLPPGLEAKAKV